jgi:uncharacterized membrane protein
MLYVTVLDVHALAMSAAIMLFLASELLLVPARREPVRIALLASRLANMLAGIGVLAGIGLVYIGGWPLVTPWLLVSLALIAVLVVIGRKFVGPWETLGRSALDDAASGVKVKTFARNKRALFGRISVLALFALVATLMVTKPDLGLAFT